MLTNKDYIVFTLGALIGAGVSYFVTKRSVQKQCYADFMAAQNEEEFAEEEGTGEIVTVDPDKRFNNYTDKLAEKREEARKLASNLEYTVEQNEFAPYLIDAAEYATGLDGYSNVRINWYPAVGKATDEVDEKEVFDVEKLCKLENLRSIESEGDSFGYIRNDKKKLDIEVFVCYAEWPLDESDSSSDSDSGGE